jgi:hypothetical protein
MGDGSPGLCLAAAYLADTDDFGPDHTAVCHLGAVDHLLAALASETAYMKAQSPTMDARTVALLAGSLGELAQLLARTAESMVDSAHAAGPSLDGALAGEESAA